MAATTSHELSATPREDIFSAIAFGMGKGLAIAFLIFAGAAQAKKFSSKSFNSACAGLVLGMAAGWALTNALKNFLSLASISTTNEFFNIAAITIYLASIYYSLYFCIAAKKPWMQQVPAAQPQHIQAHPAPEAQKKDILIDLSALEDTRLIDLARTGLLDGKLVLPSFVMQKVLTGCESLDESERNRYKKCADAIKRLENIPNLNLVHKEYPSDSDDCVKSIIRAAKQARAAIIASDNLSLKQQDADGIQIICLENIANFIKPTAQRGEALTIKIQRPGKEPKQGVGYLEDGTMVVVNGGGDFLGETIKTQVLSQKYSTSGKIIFCNALQSEDASPGNTPYYAPQPQKQEAFVAYVPRYKKDSHDSRSGH